VEVVATQWFGIAGRSYHRNVPVDPPIGSTRSNIRPDGSQTPVGGRLAAQVSSGGGDRNEAGSGACRVEETVGVVL
jgi:hypothetical protein